MPVQNLTFLVPDIKCTGHVVMSGDWDVCLHWRDGRWRESLGCVTRGQTGEPGVTEQQSGPGPRPSNIIRGQD